MKKTERAFSLLLCGVMLLSLCTPTAFAAQGARAGDVYVEVGSHELMSTTDLPVTYATTTEDGIIQENTPGGGGTEEPSEWNIKFEQNNGTPVLTLKDAYIREALSSSSGRFTAIGYDNSNMPWEIRLIGENRIDLSGLPYGSDITTVTPIWSRADLTITSDAPASLTVSSDGTSAKDGTYAAKVYGIYCSGSVTISGSAQVTAESGQASGTSGEGISGGIYCWNDFTICDTAQVTAEGGPVSADSSEGTSSSYGLQAGKSVTISDAAQVTAEGGPVSADSSEGTSSSYGLQARRSVTISDAAQVTAKGGPLSGNGKMDSYGFLCQGGTGNVTISGSARLTATGGTVSVSGNNEANSYGFLSGKQDPNVITIGGDAKVEAAGGSAVSSAGDACSCGFNCWGDITITDSATVKATGDQASGNGNVIDSYGFSGGTNITISGSAEVTATGGPSSGFGTAFYIARSLQMRDHARLTAESSRAQRNTAVLAQASMTMQSHAILKATALGTGDRIALQGLGVEISDNAQATVVAQDTLASGYAMRIPASVSGNAQLTAVGEADVITEVSFSGGRFCIRTKNGLADFQVSPTADTPYIWRGNEEGGFQAPPHGDIGSDTKYFEITTGYPVTLHPNGGTLEEGQNTIFGYELGKETPLPAVTREHCRFGGWYAEEDFTGAPVTAIGKAETGDKIFYAKWEPETYAVTLETNGGAVQSGNITSYTYGTPTALPTAAEIQREGYNFGGWYERADLTGEPLTDIPADAYEDKTYYAKWVSTDTSIKSVAVDGIPGTIEGDAITVVLPYGQQLPTSADGFEILPTAEKAEIREISDQGNGQWRFAVQAESGDTKVYTLSITIGEDPAKDNRADIAALLAELKKTEWTVEQGTANTEKDIAAWINARLKGMELNGVHTDLLVEKCTPAVAGDAANKEGTNGSFSFLITLNKGEGNAAATNYAELTGTITATPFSHTHAWAEEWQKNDTHHWHNCAAEGCPITVDSDKNAYAAHELTWDSDSSGHWQTCSVCGWKSSTAAHTYDNAVDAACNDCGYIRTITPGKPDNPDTPSNPGGSGGSGGTSKPGDSATPSVPDTPTLEKENWNVVTSVMENPEEPVYTYTGEGGTLATGSRYIETSAGEGRRYLFDEDGVLQTGASPTPPESGASIYISEAGDVLLNGHLYYLNPDRNLADPRTCYAMTDYLRIRPNYAGQTYYTVDGITFAGWIKTREGGLRYQARIAQPGMPHDLYLFVWRAQILPAGYHPDHPGDPAWLIPAGRYLFDDEGLLVQEEGWHACGDGNSYFTDMRGRILQERKG